MRKRALAMSDSHVEAKPDMLSGDEPHLSESLPPTPKNTTLWVAATGVSQAWKFMLTVASTIVLGRLLSPQDFGLVATIGPIVGFIDLIKDLGFSQALIQRDKVSTEQAHALFWTSAVLTAAAGLLLVALSPLVAGFFHEPRLAPLLLTAALSMQFSAMGAQAWAFLNRRLQFYDIAAIDVIQSTVSLCVSAAIAFVTHSYWALVLGGLAATFVSASLAILRSGWRPGRPRFDAGVAQMLKFGAGVSISNIMNYLSRNSDNLLIAKGYGSTQLGLYDRAYKLMLFPISQISWPLSRVLTPVLSRAKGTPGHYRELYLSTLTLLMLATQPALIVATVYAHATVVALLGAKWSLSAPIFAWLGAAAIGQVASTTIGWLYLSQGRSRHYAISGLVTSTSTIISFVAGLPWGPVGVATAYAVSDYLFRLPFAIWYVGRVGPVSSRNILRSAWAHGLACSVVLAAAFGLRHVVDSPGLLELVCIVAAAYPLYALVLCLDATKRELLVKSIKAGLKQVQSGVARLRGRTAGTTT